MNIHHFVLPLVFPPACATSQFAFGATPGVTSELDQVTVAAPAIRADVRNACPGIDAQLQQSRSSAWVRVHRAEIIPIQFA